MKLIICFILIVVFFTFFSVKITIHNKEEKKD
jgi:hypothetical protein